MVTGYTAPIVSKEGISFNDFVLHCSKAFIIRMKERSGDVPEKFECSNYHLKRTEEAKKKYEEFTQLSEEDKKKQWQEEINKIKKSLKESNLKTLEAKEKYEDMLIKVRQWTPPTKDHQGLKDFMIQQIESSIEYDIHFFKRTYIKDYNTWINEKIEKLNNDISYHTNKYRKEVKRVNEMNEWIKKLRESLKI